MTRGALAPEVDETLAWLHATASADQRADLARYGIPQDNALGIAMRDLKAKGKALGRDHALARALWDSGLYEARTLAAFVAEPARMTRAEADAWAAGFDSWAICDTVCFHLFDRLPCAWQLPDRWAPDERLYVRRAAFALIWALALHDKRATDERFSATLPLMRTAAADDRPHVTKAIDMALRAVGRRNAALNRAARELCADLASFDAKPARWIGSHAGRDLAAPKVLAKFRDR